MAAALAPLHKTKDPKTHAAALKDPRAPKWLEATETEWNGLWDKGCFESVPSAGKQTMRLMWVYKLKSDGRYKARLVVDGRQQDPSTYGSIASPTMKLTSMRILLALAAKNQWQIYADDAQMCACGHQTNPCTLSSQTGTEMEATVNACYFVAVCTACTTVHSTGTTK